MEVRLKIPRWQNIVVQLIGQLVFWSSLLIGISAGLQQAIIGGVFGAIIALVIALIPGIFAELQVITRKDS